MKFQSMAQGYTFFMYAIRAIYSAAIFCVVFALNAPASFGQYPNDQVVEKIDSHLQFGEFGAAIDLAKDLPAEMADQQLAEISSAQARMGAGQAALDSLNQISNDVVRFKVLAQQGLFGGAGGPVRNLGGGNLPGGFGPGSGLTPGGNGTVNGFQGGVTEADFQPLMRLIRNTISPDEWQDSNGDGTMQAYPAGVYVDSKGALKKIKVDTKRSLAKLAQRSSFSNGAFTSGTSSLRKISLQRLEKRAQRYAAEGRPIPDDLHYLSGMYEVRYVMLLPESNDIVIAGPAGPWELDDDGHAINVDTGKPVLQLDDLVVCLRNSHNGPHGNNGKFGCSITPRKTNLAATHQYISTSRLKGAAWRKGLRETLGRQDIEVFGIDPSTHAGTVLVEADYRMKLVAMGLEPTIPEIPSYLNRLNLGPDGQPPAFDVARWWFTMNYNSVTTDQDRRVFALDGTGVKVLSETEFINRDGDRIHTGQSNNHTAGFAADFTKHFDQIADEYPIYRRLKNLFDLSIVSTIIRTQGLDRKANWNMTFFGNDPEYADFVYQPPTMAAATEVDSVMNHRVIRQRKKASTVKHTLVGVSGGITFDAVAVLNEKTTVSKELISLENLSDVTTTQGARWWWDN